MNGDVYYLNKKYPALGTGTAEISGNLTQCLPMPTFRSTMSIEAKDVVTMNLESEGVLINKAVKLNLIL